MYIHLSHILGPNQEFFVLEDKEIQKYLDIITLEQGSTGIIQGAMETDAAAEEEAIIDPDA